jgi:hypothetical protein
MLANLVMKPLDAELREAASDWGMVYTRYADDLTLSTTGELNREICTTIVDEVYRVLSSAGLNPNLSKTHIVPPGARKIVLGLLVDGKAPRLTRDFRMRMRQHLYYIEQPDGPVAHASKRGFISVTGLRHHLEGLAAFAGQVEPDYGLQIMARLRSVSWPA